MIDPVADNTVRMWAATTGDATTGIATTGDATTGAVVKTLAGHSVDDSEVKSIDISTKRIAEVSSLFEY
jgi:hypothetical protein